MDFTTQIIQAEDMTDTDKLRMGITTQATSAGTLSLTRSSTCHQVFTGTIAGQIVKLPDATTLLVGFTYFFWNESTQTIAIQNNGSTQLQIAPATFNCIVVLRDNTTANGTWLISRASPGGGGTGVTPPFLFSKSGGCAVGAYLYVGQVVSSKTGQVIIGSNNIVKLTASNSGNLASNTVIQLQRRTGVSTFTDIVGASVTIPSGQYNAHVQLSPIIAIGADWEISCYNKSGSSLGDPIILVYAEPA
jgi:hypothetical protein